MQPAEDHSDGSQCSSETVIGQRPHPSVETRRSAGAGKPPVVYRAAEGSEDANSCAYRPFLLSLLNVLRERLGERAMGELLEETGRHLARSVGFGEPGDVEADLRSAMASADSLAHPQSCPRRRAASWFGTTVVPWGRRFASTKAFAGRPRLFSPRQPASRPKPAVCVTNGCFAST